jgi:hypothetical protein
LTLKNFCELIFKKVYGARVVVVVVEVVVEVVVATGPKFERVTSPDPPILNAVVRSARNVVKYVLSGKLIENSGLFDIPRLIDNVSDSDSTQRTLTSGL